MDFLKELASCNLCEHRCGVNRLKGEKGVCSMLMPEVASCTLHPAPPRSYTVFMAGCNFKCLNCQNWTISQYPDNSMRMLGYIEPKFLASQCVYHIHSYEGMLIGADRIFFSGGEPTIHLPYIEEVVKEARKIDKTTKVNFDTNGFLTEKSLERVIDFADSITFDIKAYTDETHRAITGAPVFPVLRNAKIVVKKAKQKLWEFRILVIPKFNEMDIQPLTKFIASLDTDVGVCFLTFRPNFVLHELKGATVELMNRCVEIAKQNGLRNAHWSGFPSIGGVLKDDINSFAKDAGCITYPRDCRNCKQRYSCKVKRFLPARTT
jgi:pyruvate formate lyase activating enzyme